ncbi:atesin-3 [Lyophyllum atratum]|nr:atesin-3 [Lyophyllum atratum]
MQFRAFFVQMAVLILLPAALAVPATQPSPGTCLFGDLLWGKPGKAACAAECIALEQGFRGGRCDLEKGCVCTK